MNVSESIVIMIETGKVILIISQSCIINSSLSFFVFSVSENIQSIAFLTKYFLICFASSIGEETQKIGFRMKISWL